MSMFIGQLGDVLLTANLKNLSLIPIVEDAITFQFIKLVLGLTKGRSDFTERALKVGFGDECIFGVRHSVQMFKVNGPVKRIRRGNFDYTLNLRTREVFGSRSQVVQIDITGHFMTLTHCLCVNAEDLHSTSLIGQANLHV